MTLELSDLIEAYLPCAPDGCDIGRAWSRVMREVPEGWVFFAPLHEIRRAMGTLSEGLWRELVFEAEADGRLCRPCGNTVYLAVGFP